MNNLISTENIININQNVTLSEYEKSENIFLDKKIYNVLSTNFIKYLDIINTGEPCEYILKAKQYVGIIKIGNLIIKINPKIGLENLFYLINYCYDLPIKFDEKTPLDISEEVFNYYVYIFAKEVKDIIAKGIFKKYLNFIEDTTYIKGRLLIEKNIRRNISNSLKNLCQYEEFSEDILENQILKLVTKKLVRFIENKQLDNILRNNLIYLKEISDLKIISNDDFKNLIFTRLNEGYRYPLNLARLFLENFFVKDTFGETTVSSFLVGMNKLFEMFIYKALKEKLESSELTIKYQKGFSLDDENKIRIYPDMLIFKNNIPIIVIDAKYKLTKEDEFNQSDVYQMISYCKKLGISKSILAFPFFEGIDLSKRKIFSFFNKEIFLENFYINLNREEILNKFATKELAEYIKNYCQNYFKYLGEKN